MHAALSGGDIINIGKDAFRIIVCMLKSQRNAHIILHALEHDDIVINCSLIAVEVFHIVGDAALEMEGLLALLLILFTLIHKDNFKPFVQIRQFAQPASHRFRIEFCLLKHRIVRHKRNPRAMAAGCADALQRRNGAA